MKQNDTYVRREDPSYAVSITEVKDGVVAFAAEGGGFVKSGTVERFENDFRPETPEDRAKRHAYSKDAVQLEWEDAEVRIPAWTNGRSWNGWAMPVFEKEDILKAIDDGLLLDVKYHEPADLFVSIMTTDGADAMPDFDAPRLYAELADRAAAGELYIETKIDDVDVAIELYPAGDHPTADGGTVRAYPVGAGSWCWMQYKAPEDVAAPAP